MAPWPRVVTALLLVVLVVLVVLGVAGCGESGPLWGGSGAELVAFANAGAVSTGASTSTAGEVLDSPAAADAFAGRVVERNPDAAARLRARLASFTPGPERALLGFTGLGCAETGARLRRERGQLAVKFTGGEGTRCVAASQLVAVFAVPRDELPTTSP